jgi:hypothetical protein
LIKPDIRKFPSIFKLGKVFGRNAHPLRGLADLIHMIDNGLEGRSYCTG